MYFMLATTKQHYTFYSTLNEKSIKIPVHLTHRDGLNQYQDYGNLIRINLTS